MLSKAEERELRTLRSRIWRRHTIIAMHTIKHLLTCCADAVICSCQVMLTKGEERELRTPQPKWLPHAYHYAHLDIVLHWCCVYANAR
jgi:hypothetical protein